MEDKHNFRIIDIEFVDIFNNTIQKTDIFVEEGKIMKSPNHKKHYETINGNGLYLLPSFFDLHTHSRGLEEKEKNTLEELQESALRGGYSHLLLMPNTQPPIDCVGTLKRLKKEAENLDINVYYCGCLTKGRKGKTYSPYLPLKKEGVVAYSDDGSCVQDTKLMLNICRILSKMNALIIEHPELQELTLNKCSEVADSAVTFSHWTPTSVAFDENIIVYRDLLISKETGAKIHLTHISTSESIRLIEEFNNYYNTNNSFDVTPHHLLLSVDDIKILDGTYKVKPFLRGKDECKKLQDALVKNRISIIATDHAPHTPEEKKLPIGDAPYGFIGLDFAFGLLFTSFVKTGRLGLIDLVKKFSLNPAKILNIDLKHSMFENGNFALWDLNKSYKLTEEKISSRAKNTPFIGWTIFGEPKYIFINGKLKYLNP